MKKFLLVMLVAAIGMIMLSFPIAYFKYQTGFSLLEVFDVKSRCQKAFNEDCIFIYYFYPESDFKKPELKIPKTREI